MTTPAARQATKRYRETPKGKAMMRRVRIRRSRRGASQPIQRRANRRRDPAKVKEHNWRNQGINLTAAEYGHILAAQRGRCAICHSCDPKDRRGWFHVDHDHATGRVRGLLCSQCNLTLPLVERGLTRAAEAYLEAGRRPNNAI